MYVKIRILGHNSRGGGGVVVVVGVAPTLEYIDWQFPYLRMKVSYVVKEGDQVDCQLSLQQPIDAKP